jgi:hypothetical protein
MKITTFPLVAAALAFGSLPAPAATPVNTTYKFTFGPGTPAAGSTPITPDLA